MNVYLKKKIYECKNECINVRKNVWIQEWMYVCKNECMKARMNVWKKINEWINECFYE